MRIVIGRHREGQKIKDLRLEPDEHNCELRISWTDEDGIRQTAWVKCSTLRSVKMVDAEKVKS
jgi:hypothetical protein